MGTESKTQRLDKLLEISSNCRACSLYATRTKHVFGDGSPEAPIVFIGEAPGEQEDKSGIPFVGRSGKLLRGLIQAIGLDPVKDCYIVNVVKDRPPKNRTPELSEIEKCSKFLKKQLEIIGPRILVLLGRTAVKALLPDNATASMGYLRDKSKNLGYLSYESVPVLVTYHPSALFRNPAWKAGAKEDFSFLQTLILDLYGKSRHGHASGYVPPEQLPGSPGLGLHGGKGGGASGTADRLPELIPENESLPA